MSERARTDRVVAQSGQVVRVRATPATPLRVVSDQGESQQQRFWVTARGD